MGIYVFVCVFVVGMRFRVRPPRPTIRCSCGRVDESISTQSVFQMITSCLVYYIYRTYMLSPVYVSYTTSYFLVVEVG